MPTGPGGNSGLVLDANPAALTGTLNDGDPISSLPDSSGSGNTLTQADPLLQPTFQTGVLNGLPVIESYGVSPPVSGQGGYLQSPNILRPTLGSTAIVVCRRTESIPHEHGTFFRLAQVSTPFASETRLAEHAPGGNPVLTWHSADFTGRRDLFTGPATAWFIYAITFDLATVYDFSGNPQGDVAHHYLNGRHYETFDPNVNSDELKAFCIGTGEAVTQCARGLLFEDPLNCLQVRQEIVALAEEYDLTSTLSVTSGCPGIPGGVTGYTHTIRQGSLRTVVDMAGQPKGGYKRWRPLGQKRYPTLPPGPRPEPTVPGGIQSYTLVESLTIAAAATTTTTIQAPAGSKITAVAVLVTTAIPGPTTTFSVGDSGSATRYGTANVSVAAGSSDPGTAAGIYYVAVATAIRLTMNGGSPATATGVVRVTISYETVNQ